MPSPAKILIVDDDPDIRDSLGEALREEGYEVTQFSGAREALDYLRGGARIDVILLDLFMPGLDGWDFRAEQKADPRTAGIPVISLSAGGKLVDSVGYGTATNVFVETHTAAAPATTAPPGSSDIRLPDGHDTDDNSADFTATAAPTPGAPNVAG